MNWFTGLATYLILWWLSLFIVLPLGVRGQAEENDIVHGTEPGAPVKSHMWRNVGLATLLASVFFLLVVAVVYTDVLTWERLGDWLNLRRDVPADQAG